MVSLVKHDLEFILKQIQIAEKHAAGEEPGRSGGRLQRQ